MKPDFWFGLVITLSGLSIISWSLWTKEPSARSMKSSEWLDEKAPDWRERLARGENVIIQLDEPIKDPMRWKP